MEGDRKKGGGERKGGGEKHKGEPSLANAVAKKEEKRLFSI